jgi:hypothetical protein
MHNYSLFYYAATARQGIDDDRNRLGVGAYPHPERVFFSLQASVEQAKALQIHACTILSGLDIYDKPPKHPELVYQTIGSYRNAFAHNPVLGRAVGHGRELLPPETRLPKHNKPVLWREFANIPMEEMVDLVILEEGVWQEFATFLQKQWQWLTETFLRGRNDRKFIAELGLTTLLPIHPAEGTLSVTNPIAASGTSIVPGKKT